MDSGIRAKKELVEFDLDTNKEIINLKLQLRKQHNTKKIMEQRKKRMFLSNQNELINNNLKQNNKILLESSDLLIKIPINNVSNDNINMILEYLNSDDVEKNKWAIYNLRIYFENNNPELSEYLILFENKINIYLESLLKKYENVICIINEIFYIIANLFSTDEIINKYPEQYFLYFLNEFYLSIYKKYLYFGEDELVISIFILIENILTGKNDLIKNIFYKEKSFIYAILDITNEKETIAIDVINYLMKFCKMIIIAIKSKSEYIENKDYFCYYLDKIFYVYKICDKIDLNIIKKIIEVINFALGCLCKDEHENEHYITINYLFKKRNENDAKNNFVFIHYFCSSLFNNANLYLNNSDILLSSLELFLNVTYNCNNEEMDELFRCKNYNFLSLLNNYYEYMFKLKFSKSFNETSYIIKLLCVCNNIIDSDLSFALKLIISEIFEKLIIYFSRNLRNKTIVDGFLETFIRLFGYFNKNIADNLFKRGIIYQGIFSTLLCGCQKNIFSFDKKIKFKMCKIISDYLQIIHSEAKYTRDDYLLFINFKEFLTVTNIIPEETKECILHLDYMNEMSKIKFQ